MSRRFQLAPVLTGTFAEQHPELSANQAKFGAAVASRAVLYGGSGRSEFFKGREVSESGDTVFDYVARDDSRTCTPCSEAERAGPYLPGSGAFPGVTCSGGGRCRCTRVPRYAPEEAAALRGD